ncbi:MAG: c-type cytochrome [Sulfurimonas sp.]
MLKPLIILFALSSLFPLKGVAEEDFISHYEYGEMLYKHPRGISCAECHGPSGEGKTIAEFRDIHGKKQIRGADIRKKSLQTMKKALNSYHDIMPKYYLTDEEIKAIYDFIQERHRRKRAE